MDAERLVALAHDVASGLPETELTWPFGPDWDVYKVGGKVFMLLSELHGEPIVTIKADPVESIALRQEYEDVTPGYHMNKRHWITLRAGAVPDALVRELVTSSYLLVCEGLPRAKRPLGMNLT